MELEFSPFSQSGAAGDRQRNGGSLKAALATAPVFPFRFINSVPFVVGEVASGELVNGRSDIVQAEQVRTLAALGVSLDYFTREIWYHGSHHIWRVRMQREFTQ